jgi:hypothetical protein
VLKLWEARTLLERLGAHRCHAVSCLVSFNSFAEYAHAPNPETRKKDVSCELGRAGSRQNSNPTAKTFFDRFKRIDHEESAA